MKVKSKFLTIAAASGILSGCFSPSADSFDTHKLAQELQAIDSSIVEVETYTRRISFVTDLVMNLHTTKDSVDISTLQSAINTVSKHDLRAFVDVRFTFYDPKLEPIDLTSHAAELGLPDRAYFDNELAIDTTYLSNYTTSH